VQEVPLLHPRGELRELAQTKQHEARAAGEPSGGAAPRQGAQPPRACDDARSREVVQEVPLLHPRAERSEAA
jgi:hypothetical protein